MRKRRKYYIETYGCEMNKSDSVDIALSFEERGYEKAASEMDADVVILNTCAVRENAEERLLGRLGYYRALKGRINRGAVVVLAGCMAQERGEELAHLFPELAVVAGTYHALDMPFFVEQYKNAKTTRLAIEQQRYTFSPFRGDRAEGWRAWVNIIVGCSNYCSYCIVPHLRGPEISKKSFDIVREVRELAERGVVEITLLGQNVNAYGKDSCDIGFVELLGRLNDVEGIQWIRFLTSHPKDFSRDMVRAIAGLEKVCKHFHLPLQSGSDRILRLMNRGYTVEHYLRIADEIRGAVPYASLTTDLIAGFPQESEEDFLATCEVVKKVRFDDAFTYRYSARPFTAARSLPGAVDGDVASERLAQLIELQRSISREQSLREIGSVKRVLVERRSKKDPGEFLCKTETGKMVAVRTDARPGSFIGVLVSGISGNTLRGVETAKEEE